MKSMLRRRPSAALVISCTALFLSLGGVSYGVATGSIESREIKNNTITSADVRNNTLRTQDIRDNDVRGVDIRNSTIQGKDVAFNTLTGADISEKDLAQVPSAAKADSAKTVDLLKAIAPTTVPEGGAPVTLATQGPLTLRATCEPSGADTNARLYVQTTEPGSAAGGTVQNPSIAPTDGPVLVSSLTDDGATAGRTVGSTPVFASAPSGKAFTGQVARYADASGAGSCLFYGQLGLEG